MSVQRPWHKGDDDKMGGRRKVSRRGGMDIGGFNEQKTIRVIEKRRRS